MAPHSPAYGGSGPILVCVSWMELLLTTIIIAVRAYTKIKLVPRGGWWALFRAICAWAVGVFNGIAYTVAARFGMGNHESNLSDHDFSRAMHWVWVGNATTLISISFGKIAVVAFLLTIQGETYRTKRHLLYFLCTSTVLLNLTTVIIIFLQCDPPRKLWEPELPGNCNMEEVNGKVGYVGGAYGAFVDLALAVYSVSLVYNLQIGKRMKLGISTLMAAGVFSAVCATVKTVEVARVADASDRTYVLTPLALWGATEMWMVIIACSVPACWPLAAHLFRKAKSRSAKPKCKTSGPDNHRAFQLHDMGDSYHASAEGRRDMSGENSLLENGIMMRKDLSVQQELEREVSIPGLRKKSSAEDDMRDAISAAERV
ncbi:hypothetical protein ABVK25_002891 [Lepraria finkii]|uniref:Rhodopsin domain-containing protein n=1 Tax=Lepraria finkii TaxID=1340010 RepID=A0ABR4BID8_9LECA